MYLNIYIKHFIINDIINTGKSMIANTVCLPLHTGSGKLWENAKYMEIKEQQVPDIEMYIFYIFICL